MPTEEERTKRLAGKVDSDAAELANKVEKDASVLAKHTDANTASMVAALNDVAEHIQNLTISATSLSTEVSENSLENTRKITWLQRSLFVMSAAIILLLGLAVTNFFILTHVNGVAKNAQQTNTILVDCFKPNTSCAKLTKKQNDDRNTEVRQTLLVLAKCQREHPAAIDPDGTKTLACVQKFYPGLAMPPEAK